MKKEIIRIGPVEFYREDLEKLYVEKKYILTSTAVYQIMFSTAQNQFYGHRVYHQSGARFLRPGRFMDMTGKQINNLLGFDLLADL